MVSRPACPPAGKTALRWERARVESRGRILDAAATVFQHDGYERANMLRIAHAAGMSKVTLYAHFRDKARLFCAVMDHHLSCLPPPARPPSDALDLRRKLDWVATQIRDLAGQQACRSFCRTLARSSEAPGIYLERWEARLLPYRRYVADALAHERVAAPDVHADQFMLLVLSAHALLPRAAAVSGDAAVVVLFERAFARRGA